MPNRQRTLIVSIALLVAVCLAYCGIWRFEFVHYDDNTHIFGNERVNTGLSLSNVGWAFRQFNGAQWIPLTWLSFMADVSLFGLNPGAMHCVNIALHALNAVLLFLLLHRLTREFWPAAAVAAIYALHPVNVESVAWLSERKNVLSTAFWLLSTLSYVRYAESGRRAWMLACFLCLALGLMVKAMLVTLPCTLLLLDAWPLGRNRTTSWPRLVLEKLPLFALSALASFLQMKAAANDGLLWEGSDAPTFAYRAMNAGANILQYMQLIFIPTEYAPMLPLPREIPVAMGLAGWAFSAATLALGWRLRASAPYVLVGFLWFLGTQFPVSGIVGAGDAVRCDRYLYIPEIGVLLVAVWALKKPVAKLSREAAVTLATAILGTLAWLTHDAAAHWRNTTALATHAAAVSPESVPAHKLAGWVFAHDGKFAEALRHYDDALQLAPGHLEIRCARAVILAKLGQRQPSIAEFRAILAASPDHLEAKVNLGMQLFATGDLAQARAILEPIAVPGTNAATIQYWLARIAHLEGKRDEAKRRYTEALRLARDEPWMDEALDWMKLL